MMPRPPKMLHIAEGAESRCLASALFRSRLSEFGELTIVPDGSSMTPDKIAQLVRQHDIYLAGWSSVSLPVGLAADPGRLKYICGITGAMHSFVPLELVDAQIPLTNWGDAPANGVAEGALLLLLASVKSMHARIQWARRGNYWGTPAEMAGTLEEMNVGVYGCGVIGRRFIELLQPFGASIRVFDPYLSDPPPDCQIVHSLKELFAESEAIVIHAGLTPETRNTITAELIASLPDGGIIVNTARGGIVDQEALFKELESGRLRAALDVLEPDNLDPSHPAYQWENLILTGHAIAVGPQTNPARPRLERMEQYCLENIHRFVAGKPLRFVMDPVRFRRST